MGEGKGPYIFRPLQEYLGEAASRSSTPGGGSVSALAGALGTTMASMAANFTVGKKKFAEVEDAVKEELARLEGARVRLIDAMQADTEAYAEVSKAYGMAKATDDEKAARREAIQRALKIAMKPPLATLESCLDALRATRHLLDIANPNLVTDVGVAALLLEAAAKGAHLNVAINLNGIKDGELVSKTRSRCASLLDEAARLAREVEGGVAKALE